MKKTRLNKRGKQVVTAFFIVLIVIVMMVVGVGVKVYEKYSPTKERMTYKEYFELHSDEEVLVYMNDEQLDMKVIVENGKCYIPREYVVSELNCRFYKDVDTNQVIFSVPDNMYTFITNEASYVDMYGAAGSTDFVVVKNGTDNNGEDELFIALDYVKQYSDVEYRFYEEPNRLFMWDVYEEKIYTQIDKNTVLRFRGGIKSPIIADLSAGQEVEFLEDYEDWIEVRTEDGYLGYVSAKRVGEIYQKTMESTFVEQEAPESTKFNGKINIAFNAVGSAAYSAIDTALKGTTGINVVSPTWYSLTSNDGKMSCFANKDYVKNAHAKGAQVWALVDDFNTEIDRLEILSHKSNRDRIINKLVSDAKDYGFDGINIDFEKVTTETAPHYLQFMRELSFACRKSNIILSTDNYVPMGYNMHYNRKELGFWLDYVIIMGYDEHWKGDSEAGPVASIKFVEDGIVNTLAEVPVEKVINAMPYYERVWYEKKNTDGTVSVSSRDMSMEAAESLLKSNGGKTMWDEDTCLYYGSYESGSTTVKVWLENATTLEEKMKLYQKYNLAGVAGWRLGLENTDVWPVIESYLR